MKCVISKKKLTKAIYIIVYLPVPACGKPQVVANGYWVPVEGTDGRRATLQCKDGYYTPIEKVRIICSLNGTWTNVEVQCNIGS